MEIGKIGKPFKAKINTERLIAIQPSVREQLKILEKEGTRVGKEFDYPGVLVPYEVKLKNGDVRKHNLAIRCDNSQRRWEWDGGL